MRKYLEKIFLLITVLSIFIGCCVAKKVPVETEEAQLGQAMWTDYVIKNAVPYQLDSICLVDTLPQYNRWIIQAFVDLESGERVIKRMYVKKKYNGEEHTYIIEGKNPPFIVTRRISKQ